MTADYRDRWLATCSALGASVADSKQFDELLARYRERHRHYHTMQHLDECFAAFATLRELAQHPAEIEIALWFHDAIYGVREPDNEQRSADWARGWALSTGVAGDAADRIHALVMATRHHALPESRDEGILVDVDLSILGSEPARFDEYEHQVRAEYAWVPEDTFRSKRREILLEFLARARIYSTDRCAEMLEQKARANLRRSIAMLGG